MLEVPQPCDALERGKEVQFFPRNGFHLLLSLGPRGELLAPEDELGVVAHATGHGELFGVLAQASLAAEHLQQKRVGFRTKRNKKDVISS